MNKLVAVLMVGISLVWATGAFAYSALDEAVPFTITSAGAGIIVISGDDTAGESQSEAYPTVNLSGVYDWAAWQVFYGVDSDASLWGGSLDYILVSNFDECEPCTPQIGTYWFGAGASFISASDLFLSGTGTATTGVDTDDFGPNLGLGYMWGDWTLNLYAHYFLDSELFAGQAAILYNFN